MKTSKKGIELIKKHEGLRLEAYLCAGGKWTIGYGHTLTARQGMHIDALEAERLLRNDLTASESVVNAALPNLAQHQFDALVSFVFNVGARAFLQSTLLKKIRQGVNQSEIRHEFIRWTTAGGKTQPGLLKRRNDEADMFLNRTSP